MDFSDGGLKDVPLFCMGQTSRAEPSWYAVCQGYSQNNFTKLVAFLRLKSENF
jgi:hypothetical protein